jgi:hypothetical protein
VLLLLLGRGLLVLLLRLEGLLMLLLLRGGRGGEASRGRRGRGHLGCESGRDVAVARVGSAAGGQIIGC